MAVRIKDVCKGSGMYQCYGIRVINNVPLVNEETKKVRRQ